MGTDCFISWDRGNSREAWDDAFAPGGHWDKVNGDALTECFGRCILENLNPEVTEYLETARTWVLDWGCARGQTAVLFRERFPRARVVGLDFAERAITQARQRYGGHFIYEREGRIRWDWDVIVNSNVLEHLPDPIGVVREHLSHTNAYYIILVPYDENLDEGNDMTVAERQAAGHAHLHRFSTADFPDEVGGTRCIQRDVVEPGPAWPGHQLLLVYKT